MYKRICWAIMVFTGFILFSGNWIAEQLHIISVKKDYGFVLGLFFVASASPLIVEYAIDCYWKIKNIIARRKHIGGIEDEIDELLGGGDVV